MCHNIDHGAILAHSGNGIIRRYTFNNFSSSTMSLVVKAIHTFVAEHGDELEFQAGESITVIEKDDAFGDGWWRVRRVSVSADVRVVTSAARRVCSPPRTSRREERPRKSRRNRRRIWTQSR